MIELAIVGVGWAGQRQAEAIRELEAHPHAEVSKRLRLAAFVDPDADHLHSQQERFGVPSASTDLAEVLANDRIKAISIATPHALHAAQSIAASSAGKHVLVEKPMAMTVDEATAMLDAASANKVELFVAESEVYTPFVDVVKDMLETDPGIGEPIHASVREGFRPSGGYGYPGRREWLTKRELGGTGPWALNGIHTVARIRAILGEVDEVFIRKHHTSSFASPDIEGTMAGVLVMSSGIVCDIVESCELDLGGIELTILGEHGSIRATTTAATMQRSGEPPASPVDTRELDMSQYARELLAFADHIEGRQTGPTDGHAERRSLAIVQAGYESAASGLPVVLAERFGPI